MSKKSILTETLSEIQEIKDALQKNANYVLKSTLREDLEDIMKNGLADSETDGETNDMGGDLSPANLDAGDDNPDGLPTEELPTEELPTEELPAALGDEFGAELGDDVETIDLTDQGEDEVLKQFSLMEPADEIEIVKTANGLSINIKQANSETAPEIGGEMEPEMGGEMTPNAEPEMGGELGGEMTPNTEPEMGGEMEPEMGGEMGGEMGPEDDEEDLKEVNNENKEEDVVYEFEVKDKDTEDADKPKKEVSDKEKELHESLIKTRRKIHALVTEVNNKTAELETTKQLVNEFKSNEAEYKSAIKNLKTQLQEVALFTSNLTYVVKLMTENSTTKDEKINILKRFDSAKTITESREIFKTLETTFTEKNGSKIIENTLLGEPKGSGSANLNEAAVYKNPQVTRILEIMAKTK